MYAKTLGRVVYLLEFGKFCEIRRDSFLNVGLFTLVAGSDGCAGSPALTVGRSGRRGGGSGPGYKRRGGGFERKRGRSFGRRSRRHRRKSRVTEVTGTVRASCVGRGLTIGNRSAGRGAAAGKHLRVSRRKQIAGTSCHLRRGRVYDPYLRLLLGGLASSNDGRGYLRSLLGRLTCLGGRHSRLSGRGDTLTRCRGGLLSCLQRDAAKFFFCCVDLVLFRRFLA